MSLEAINKIRDVEGAMDQAKADAKAQAQKLLADAEREGRTLLEKGRQDSTAKAAEVMKAAEAKAGEKRTAVLEATKQECAKLTADADARMAQAAKMIVERVVES